MPPNRKTSHDEFLQATAIAVAYSQQLIRAWWSGSATTWYRLMASHQRVEISLEALRRVGVACNLLR